MISNVFKPRFISPLLAVMVSLIPVGGSQAQIPIDPRAEEVLQSFSAYLVKSTSIEVHPFVSVKVQAGKIANQTETKGDVFVGRPNKVSIEVLGGKLPFTFKSDGLSFNSLLPTLAAYTTQPAPANLPGYLKGIEGRVLNQQLPFQGFLFADSPHDFFVADATAIEYVGSADLEGLSCHQLRVIREPASIDLFIEFGDRPLLHRIYPDTAALKAQIAASLPGASIEMDIRFNDWKLDGAIPAETFAFSPPDWAEKRDSLVQGRSQDAALALVKKKAPNLDLPLMDGTAFNLEEHKGKIVILDFWATWCQPCVMGLPILDEVAEAYADKGVVFVAVNIEGIEEDAIQMFLDRYQYDFHVGVDKTRSAAAKYRVGPIPQTVIVGKEGTVQAVHLGLAPDLKESLSGELDKLLEGKNLYD